MTWTEMTLRYYQRAAGRYASGLMHREWAFLARLMPAVPAIGRPRETDLRSVMNAILDIAATR